MNTTAQLNESAVGSRPRKKIPEPKARGEHILDATYRMLDEGAERYRLAGSSRRQLLYRVAEGTGLPYEWLAKLARQVIDDPGVKKIHLVHGWLVKHQKDTPA